MGSTQLGATHGRQMYNSDTNKAALWLTASKTNGRNNGIRAIGRNPQQDNRLFNNRLFNRNDEIHVKDVLNHTNWSLIHNTKSFKDIAFLCIVTAIIAEHSFFLWKQKPSYSPAPYKLAMQNFNLSIDMAKINTAIEEASHMKTKEQKKQALVKIATDNRLPL
ncbi:uncharacterized protein LACBIDRAFT_335310 [Laccaria bicolor S238N-H82]|uniref:Predicted protein n=1 Tax=Laccaria bicolor (strain S238N-H82 / ATCC MYA-4686) TaxID=486041 RepID=B0E1Z1_LACBS|nr:uncharacterized protein LACBIDRAFT_335310 [Laccaria bicolor S238N-H82]EDQ99138.1 predicted protein [Laccaria bicolor S238N-H82]|eukprot:XP_001890201.1 predicted protein [Laccaria bicolor S238N-H82]